MTVEAEDALESRLALRLEELALPSLEEYLSPRSFSWLGEHQDEAAELAALLHEAAPKLALGSLRCTPAGSGRAQGGLPKNRSYEVSDTIRDRLRSAVPMATGPGQIDWSRLSAIISSELLKFDEAGAAATTFGRLLSRPTSAASAAGSEASASGAAAGWCDELQGPAPTPVGLTSPRTPAGGDMLEINSGGRVIFCLFAAEAPRAPTPPSSLRSSPEKDGAPFINRLAWADGTSCVQSGQGGLEGSRGTNVDVRGSSSCGDAAGAEQPSPLLLDDADCVGQRSSWQEAQQQAGSNGGDGDGEGGLYSEPSLWARSRECGSGEEGWDDGNENGEETSEDSSSDAEEQLRQLQASAAAAQRQQWQLPADGTDSSGASSSYDCSPTSNGSGGLPAGRGAQRSHGSFSFPAAAAIDGGAPAAAAGAEVGEDGGLPSPMHVPLPGRGPPDPEGCLILKFVSSRLLSQSEQFASELTRHVGLCTPDSRILRQKGATEQEWREAYEAAAALRNRFPDLYEEMTRNSCCLVMEFIPGGCLFQDPAAFSNERLQQTAEDLGRLFTLDMLLGNADRLHCRELAWRGNPENVLYATSGRWAGRAVAIDAVVQRRPPGGLMSVEDSSCERLTELALNDAEVAGSLLRQALLPCGPAFASWDAGTLRESAAAFQRGLKAALDAAVTIKGLLEMMFEVTTDWIDSFLQDIEESGNENGSGGGHGGGGHGSGGGAPVITPRSASASRRASSAGERRGGARSDAAGAPSPLLLSAAASTTAQTMRIRQINHEAQRNDSVGEKVAHWKGTFREKGEELRAAVEEWQAKRSTAAAAGAQRLTTAFLDGTHPVVDVYELKVRLEHMLQRLRVLQQATLTGRPCRLMPGLYLSGAVEASSLHLLRHLGITHILNATEDLLLPEEGQGFVTMRCPLRDIEEEDLSPHLPDASAFIDEALASGRSVLVHCHAGKSRSCSLVLAWLMTRRRWPLNRAMEFLQRVRPEAAPNAGYLAALLRLEEELFGRQTVKMKKTKPEPRSCPVCRDKVGLSAESVRVHLRLKHPGTALARPGRGGGSQDSGSGNWADSLLGSPTGSSPRSLVLQPSSFGAGGAAASAPTGALPSPRASQLAEQQQRRQAERQHLQQQYQQQHAAMERQQQQQQQQGHAAASWQAAPGGLAAVLSSPRRISTTAAGVPAQAATPAAAAVAAHEVPGSPLAMAEVLQTLEAEAGLSEGDAEEYLSAAAADMV